MTIRELRVFATVAECGKMVDASQKLYIAPASVSQTIAGIEAEYNIKLFERLNKKLYITDAGGKLLVYVKHILNLYDEMENAMRTGTDSLTVRIGSVSSVAAYRLPQILRRCQELCPTGDFQVCESKPREIEDALLKNDIDVGVTVGEIHSRDLVSLPVWQDQLVFLCAEDDPLYGREEVSLEELRDRPFILPEPGRIAREMLEEVLKRSGTTLRQRWVSRSYSSIVEAVRMGHGLSIMSRLWYETIYQTPEVGCFRLAGEELHYDVSLAYHKDKYLFPALQSFLMAFQDENTSLSQI